MSKAKELAEKAKSNITELTELLSGTAEETAKEPTAQTKASKKWAEKAGVKAKSYKISEDISAQFTEACKRSGKTQSEILTILMLSYIALTK
jgi:hypothetical protein